MFHLWKVVTETIKWDVTPDKCDTDPEIPDSNITIVAGSKHMTIYSVPLNLWGTNYNEKKTPFMDVISLDVTGDQSGKLKMTL